MATEIAGGAGSAIGHGGRAGWHHVHPAVCHGKACICGTRGKVAVILNNLAAGVPHQEIVYASMQRPDIQAALAYAAELAREGTAV